MIEKKKAHPEAVTVCLAARHDVAHEEASRVLPAASQGKPEPRGAASSQLNVPGDPDNRHFGTSTAATGVTVSRCGHARRTRGRRARGARARTARGAPSSPEKSMNIVDLVLHSSLMYWVGLLFGALAKKVHKVLVV